MSKVTNVGEYGEYPPKKKKKPVKKIVLGIVGGVVLLAGCQAIVGEDDSTATSTPSQVESVTPTPETQSPEEVAPLESTEATSSYEDEAYLSTVRASGTSTLNSYSDEELIGAGKNTCSSLDSGVTLEDMMLTLISDPTVPISNYDSGVILGGAIGVYCPQYMDQVNDLAKQYG